ncbi:MAG: phosphoribosylpyrophosphate synthetase [Chitinophagaceae bacterium]|nr:phosphoribosylpyrophosphate synthetase [Chitinophagaceae bacterium]
MASYDTVVDALNGLRERGYSINFNIAFDKIICSDNKNCLNPNEFEIAEVYRFEGNSNPADEDVVYAIESITGNTKGVLTSAFGLYADSASTAMITKLSMNR